MPAVPPSAAVAGDMRRRGRLLAGFIREYSLDTVSVADGGIGDGGSGDGNTTGPWLPNVAAASVRGAGIRGMA